MNSCSSDDAATTATIAASPAAVKATSGYSPTRPRKRRNAARVNELLPHLQAEERGRYACAVARGTPSG